MTASQTPPKVFVRNATGLRKEAGVLDVFVYNSNNQNTGSGSRSLASASAPTRAACCRYPPCWRRTGWATLAGAAAGLVTVVETAGRAGAVIHDPAGPDVRIPGIRVDPVDATGAGDCFAGALCHYLACDHDLVAACQLAIVAAGLSTLALGA